MYILRHDFSTILGLFWCLILLGVIGKSSSAPGKDCITFRFVDLNGRDCESARNRKWRADDRKIWGIRIMRTMEEVVSMFFLFGDGSKPLDTMKDQTVQPLTTDPTDRTPLWCVCWCSAMARNEPRDETTGFYLWRTSHCRVCKCGVSSVASISAFHSAKGDKPIIWFSKSPRCADSGSPWLQCKALSHEAREEVEQHMADTVFLGWRIDGWRIGFQLLIQLVQLCLRYTMIITELHISNPGNLSTSLGYPFSVPRSSCRSLTDLFPTCSPFQSWFLYRPLESHVRKTRRNCSSWNMVIWIWCFQGTTRSPVQSLVPLRRI